MARHLIEELQQRGLIAQATDLQALTERLTQGPITLYCGFDPTADSLHIGHLVTLLCLKRFQQAGHKPIILVGGATGLIGDPTFKATERKLNSQSIVQTWVEKIARQVSPFVDFDQHKSNAAMLANNQDWFSSMKVLSFLRDIGKHFSVNTMINKEAIRQRLNRNDSGISFTEFSYSLFQSYDFAVLNERYGVELQIGGSDQWGNITAGIELTRRLYQKQVYGLTVPLITKADGTKFGKTESHTVWLDANKTSPYTFYQFWLNSADADVYRFLGLFTFLTIEDIENIAAEDSASGQPPRAQQILAQEITRTVHGETGLAAALRITHSLFSGTLADLTTDDFAQLAQDGLPCLQLAGDITLPQALVAAGFSPSNAQARTLIESNAIAINSQKCADSHYAFKPSDRLYQRYTLLKRGKKHYCLICWD